jgi:hypothetical protein
MRAKALKILDEIEDSRRNKTSTTEDPFSVDGILPSDATPDDDDDDDEESVYMRKEYERIQKDMKYVLNIDDSAAVSIKNMPEETKSRLKIEMEEKLKNINQQKINFVKRMIKLNEQLIYDGADRAVEMELYGPEATIPLRNLAFLAPRAVLAIAPTHYDVDYVAKTMRASSLIIYGEKDSR